MAEWFDLAFGPWYLRLYPHRDLEEARRAVRFLAPRLPSDGIVLDGGCGPGRHLLALRERGFQPVGLDRSRALLGEAAARAPDLVRSLVRGDLRALPFRDGAFAAVLSMFTSFGYFGSRRADGELLLEFRRVLRRDGRLVLDYLNAPAVRERLVPRSERMVDGHRVIERRSIERSGADESVVKVLTVEDGDGRVVAEYREAVALYGRDEIVAMARYAGFRLLEARGDYDGAPWSPSAPRLLLVAAPGGDA